MAVLGGNGHRLYSRRPSGRGDRLVPHPPGERALGWVFGGFNRVFDKITAQYGWAVGKLLRVSAIVMVVYLGLLGLTTWRVASAPQGFLPTQDQGYLLVNVQLPDSASVQRTQEDHGAD